MTDWLTELAFWDIVAQEGRRTIICNPDHESRIKGYLAARSLDQYHNVQPTPHCPIDTMYVMPFHVPPLWSGAVKIEGLS